MLMKQIKLLIRKEFRQLMNESSLLIGFLSIPLMLTVVLPLAAGLIAMYGEFNEAQFGALANMATGSLMAKVPDGVTGSNIIVYLLFKYLFLPLILLIPVIISNVIASYSLVGEKEKKTIEGLLYTPIEMRALILGKALSAAIPAVGITWGAALVYSCIANYFSSQLFGRWIFPNAEWMLFLLVIVPLITLLSILLVLLVSQRMKSSRSAQSVSMIVVVPILGTMISQVSGVFIIDTRLIMLIIGVLCLLNWWLFKLASSKFNLERYILNI